MTITLSAPDKRTNGDKNRSIVGTVWAAGW